MRARTLMVQGTMSSVGKSLLVAALCRIFKQDGLRVAPFKAQNMALNSYATRDGLEIGRAQAMQADAAGVEVTVEMNPVLIKPEADSFAQIVVMGRPWARLPASGYMTRRSELWSVVTRALDSLRERYDLVVLEGAGSPAELNLRQGDLVNMAMAEYADAPVLLVGDIDRGGIFAQLLGTLMLLEERERARVRGLIVNKFRGDARLFDDGVKMLQERAGVPVMGVLPFIPDLRIADEDSVALDELPRVGAFHRRSPKHSVGDETPSQSTNLSSVLGPRSIQIVVIHFPHISNFDDFDPLRADPDVAVRFVDRFEDLGEPDLVILPGTKTTMADLNWLRSRGIAEQVIKLAQRGVPILGICGGYQMLGRTICDPLHSESNQSEVNGLGLFDTSTTFESEKRTVRARASIAANTGLFANAYGLQISGYEIHMGTTDYLPQVYRELADPERSEWDSEGPPAGGSPFLSVIARSDQAVEDLDGAVSQEGWIAGTYFHGLFDNDALRHVMLTNLAARKKIERPRALHFDRDEMYDRLAETVRAHLDMKAIYRLLE